MARKVFKYGPLEIGNDEPQQVHLPVNARVVFMGSKTDGFIDVWALTDEEGSEHTQARTFQIYATGEPLPEDAQYCETIIQETVTAFRNGSRVWHVFERLVD